MSDDRIFERNARAWLELGPTDPPARVIEDALRAIESTPQKRTLWSPWKDIRMTTPARFATAAVIGVLVIGGGTLLLVSSQPQVGGPSPSPSNVSPYPSLSGDVPSSAALQYRWDSVGFRPMPGSATGDSAIDLAFGQTSLSIDGFKGPVDNSWSSEPGGTLTLGLQSDQATLTNRHWTCSTGDQGTYAVRVSNSGMTLSLAPVSESCSTRASILTGDWTRWPCPNPISQCGPELSAGTHVVSWEVTDDQGSPVPSFLSRYTFTVPAGWSMVAAQWLGRRNDPATLGIRMTLDPTPRIQVSDCSDRVEPGIARTPIAVTSWVDGLRSVVSTTPVQITIGGYDGAMIDVSLDPAWRVTCGGGPPSATTELFMGAGDLQGDGHTKAILLDVGGGHVLLIEITGPDEASWSEFVAAASPIVNSLEFSR